MSKHGRKSIPLQKSQTSDAHALKSQTKGLITKFKSFKASAEGYIAKQDVVISRLTERVAVLTTALKNVLPAPGFPKCDRTCNVNASGEDRTSDWCDCGMEEIRKAADAARAVLIAQSTT